MEKVKWILGLKGICAVIVLLRHFANAFLPALYDGKIESTKMLIGGGVN